MKLLRRHKPDHVPGPSIEAVEAHERAKYDLARVSAQSVGIRALGDRLRQVQERNHLAEAFEHALRGAP